MDLFYNELYPSDPRYNDFNEGLHQQGSLNDVIIWLEIMIDIEFLRI
jgi:hypothetical protein